ncbi:hypothetical protein SAMN05414139_06278 [Burkholderia sp. D7]|nr:hypothetical protein SAMN05414139_06278 [Burkholderia sp. D7]
MNALTLMERSLFKRSVSGSLAIIADAWFFWRTA